MFTIGMIAIVCLAYHLGRKSAGGDGKEINVYKLMKAVRFIYLFIALCWLGGSIYGIIVSRTGSGDYELAVSAFWSLIGLHIIVGIVYVIWDRWENWLLNK